jgi:recombination protein RecT
MRCAQDGLIPDGRQAVLVIYKDRNRGLIVQYQQMVAGVRILVQQSGEISRFEQVVVHANDKFEYRLGDAPQISHIPAMERRGEPLLVYSIAQFRDGTLSREVMTVEEVEKVRQVSRAAEGNAWRDWWTEMARKTVAKRHAKSLPMSNDAATALARDDQEHFALSALPSQVVDFAPGGRPRLSQKLDALAQPSSAESSPPRRRGRPRKPAEHDLPSSDEPVPDAEEFAEPEPEAAEDDQQLGFADKVPDDWPGPRPDFDQGVRDAEAGNVSCLNRDIRANPVRMNDWMAGFNSVKRKQEA